MTGYESKRAAAQDKLAQPALEPNWACNECGAQEFTSALSEADLDYLACSTCGGNEFHKEALAQPVQEPVAWGVFEGNLHDMFFTEAEAVEMAQLKGTHAEVKPLYTKEKNNAA